ncbi:CBS-domain-containing protein [Pleomassaria siparia CBS 279.74]|uniref:CBS-domain-containing protein n=1 Tax=Pleomassaria siparia CBS 279.74 TaxID=1314801 RepID=A0A6G1KCY3_9PLEO|nr:CBS-domain-containing protein [Pleomassaria siparia CBS 279.74]
MSGVDIADSAMAAPPNVPISDVSQAQGKPAFVAPRTYLDQTRPVVPPTPLSAVDREQMEGLRTIRAFLKVRTSYDVLPLSFRLIVFDTSLLVKKSLNILIQNGIVSAPLWDSKTSTFAGLLTTSDYINVIQYYWQNPDALARVDQFRLNSLRDIEKALGVTPIETVSIHPERPLYEACRKMLESRARRIPLVDIDDETHRTMVVSVITQYRILKFITVNIKETQKLRKPLRDLPHVGTYSDLASAFMDTPVMDVIHMLVQKNISSVPILDKDKTVINVFEAVDVITLIKGGVYDDLNLSVGEALLKRSDDFPGIYTCSMQDQLSTIYDTIRKSRVHRFIIIDEDSRLKGVLTLSDILEYTLLEGEADE